MGAGGSFHDTLSKALTGLLNANNERKSEIDTLRSDHDQLRKDHDAFVTSAERENDLRRNEIKSLRRECKKKTRLVSLILPNWMVNSIPKTMLAKPKSPIWTTLPSLRTMLVSLTLPI